MRTFIIAEAGVNHNGSEEIAFQLIEVAAQARADAVKFQTFTAEKLVTAQAEKAEYQKNTTGEGSQYEMLKRLELSEEAHRRLFLRCNEVGIEFMSTPFDADAADFLIDLGMKRIKVPSGEITNFPFIEHLAKKDLPMIVSTGMSALEEVQEAVQLIESIRKKFGFKTPLREILTLLHCTSNYPADCQNVNLLAMKTMADATGLKVGYSDHTLGTVISTAAVALGATTIEKHFTLDKAMNGPDHVASLNPDELNLMISNIRDVEIAMGSAVKQPTQSELLVREVARRSVVAKRAIVRNTPLTNEDLVCLRPGKGIEPKFIPTLLGRTVLRDIEPGEVLSWSDLAV